MKRLSLILILLLCFPLVGNAARFDWSNGQPAITDDSINTTNGARYDWSNGQPSIVRTAPTAPPAAGDCFHSGGDWFINTTCYIGTSTTTQGTIFIVESGQLNIIDNAVVSANKVHIKNGLKINIKQNSRLTIDTNP